MDVVSLYTSIPHADGLRALTFFLDRRPPEARYPSTTTLVRLAELVLTLNTFEFDGQIFHNSAESLWVPNLGLVKRAYSWTILNTA